MSQWTPSPPSPSLPTLHEMLGESLENNLMVMALVSYLSPSLLFPIKECYPNSFLTPHIRQSRGAAVVLLCYRAFGGCIHGTCQKQGRKQQGSSLQLTSTGFHGRVLTSKLLFWQSLQLAKVAFSLLIFLQAPNMFSWNMLMEGVGEGCYL